MSGPVEKVVDALVAHGCSPRPSGAGWSACCPAHDDRDPSLSVNEGQDECALVSCHAGCETEMVVAALGLSMGDLFAEREHAERRRIVDIYQYEGAFGEPLYVSVREEPKRFWLGRRNGDGDIVKGRGGVDPVLYHLPEVLRGVYEGRSVWVAEGEKDVDALRAAGVYATCNPMGATNWRADYYARDLFGASEVVVVVDKDRAGWDWARAVVASLDGRVGGIRTVEAAIGKDAADHLGAGLELDKFVDIDVTIPVAVSPGAVLDLLVNIRNGAWLDAQDFPPLRYAVPGLVPEGYTLLVGPPKIGKSWFVLSAALAIASGGHAFGHLAVDRRPVLYLALEDGHRRVQDRCRKLLEGGPIPAGLEYLIVVEPGMVLATVEMWLDRYGADEPVILLDTLGKVMPPALIGESSYQRDYRIGSALKRLVDSWPGSSLVVNHHDRKADSEDFVDAVSGTHGLAGAADTILVLTRARHESDGLVQVTGRDVAEGEYALKFTAGASWQLDGDSLEAAAARAEQVRATAGLGGRSIDIVEYVGEHPEGVTAADVVDEFGIAANQARSYLSRLHDKGRLERGSRGLYRPVASVALLRSEAPERNNAAYATPLREVDLVAELARRREGRVEERPGGLVMKPNPGPDDET